jgi:hypothetical protein
MIRVLTMAFLVCTATAHAQRAQIWVNPGLTERGLQIGEQQIVLRQDMSQCHGSAFEQTRPVEDEHKRKTLGVAVFHRCMADKGWLARDPAPRKTPPKAQKETAT